MLPLARLLQILTLVVWIGGLIFFAFVLAPTAFRVLPSVHEAGLIVGAALRVFDLIALTCGVLFLAATILLFRAAPFGLRRRYEVQFLLTAIMVAATAYLHWSILPAMDRDRDATGGDVTLVASSNPARAHFDKLHARSERVEGIVLLVGLVVVVLASRVTPAAALGTQSPDVSPRRTYEADSSSRRKV